MQLFRENESNQIIRLFVTKVAFVLASNNFRKSFYTFPCVWLRMENRVFRKIIYFDRKIRPLTW